MNYQLSRSNALKESEIINLMNSPIVLDYNTNMNFPIVLDYNTNMNSPIVLDYNTNNLKESDILEFI